MSSTTTTPSEVPPIESHGASIPALGLGTWELQGDAARRLVENALDVGYRHLDTAEAYGNEAEVGRALRASGLDREQLFLTTKVWPDHYAPTDFRDAVAASLERLGVDAVDLLLLHWPRFRGTTLEETVDLLNEARAEGRARHIGVSNFNTRLLTRAAEASEAPLAVNQVEYHPFLDQSEVLASVRERGMALTAYSPLAHGRVPGDRTLSEIGERHGKTAAQVALRWLLDQERVAAIPRTSDPEHCAENFRVFDFRLSEEERAGISRLAEPGGRVIDPVGLAPDWD